jgi:hypothetical protein
MSSHGSRSRQSSIIVVTATREAAREAPNHGSSSRGSISQGSSSHRSSTLEVPASGGAATEAPATGQQRRDRQPWQQQPQEQHHRRDSHRRSSHGRTSHGSNSRGRSSHESSSHKSSIIGVTTTGGAAKEAPATGATTEGVAGHRSSKRRQPGEQYPQSSTIKVTASIDIARESPTRGLQPRKQQHGNNSRVSSSHRSSTKGIAVTQGASTDVLATGATAQGAAATREQQPQEQRHGSGLRDSSSRAGAAATETASWER